MDRPSGLTILLLAVVAAGGAWDLKRGRTESHTPKLPAEVSGWTSADAGKPEGLPADGAAEMRLYLSPFGEAVKAIAVRADALDRMLDPGGTMRTPDWRRTADVPVTLGKGGARLMLFRSGEEQLMMFEWRQRPKSAPQAKGSVHRPWRQMLADLPDMTTELMTEPHAWTFRVYGLAQRNDRKANQLRQNLTAIAETVAAGEWR